MNTYLNWSIGGLLVAVLFVAFMLISGPALAHGVDPKRLPRGIRNKNPGNLRDTGIKWKGLTGADSNGYAIFDTIDNGLRAMAIDVIGDIAKRGKNKLEPLFMEYAPSADNNDPAAYARAVAAYTGISLDSPINYRRDGAKLLKAIVEHENGAGWGERAATDAQYQAAVNAAIKHLGL